MKITNEIVLRPRFDMEVELPSQQVLENFTQVKKEQKKFSVSVVDDHIFLKLQNGEQHFWSPQLHLEIKESTESRCLLHGFFGPNPTVWTMFIFFHVVVGTIFLADSIWIYSNYSLGESYSTQLLALVFLVMIWILLYIAGSIGKAKGKPGMQELYDFMKETLDRNQNSETLSKESPLLKTS